MDGIVITIAAILLTSPPPYSLVPPPQSVQSLQGSDSVFTSKWFLATDTSNTQNVFDATYFQNNTYNATGVNLTIKDTEKMVGNEENFVIFGESGQDKMLDKFGAEKNISIQDLKSHANNSEAYVMYIGDNVIVILGVQPSGAFYGLQTLLQILNQSCKTTTDTSQRHIVRGCSIPSMKIADWPDLAIRGAHIHKLGSAPFSPVFLEQANRMAMHKMNFFSAMVVNDISTDLERFGYFQLAMQKYVQQRHMTYVPVLSLGTGLADVRTGEGIWAKNVACSANASGFIVPIVSPYLPLKNGDFENVSSGGTIPGWRQFSRSGSSWSIDSSYSHSGAHSVKFEATTATVNASSTLLSQPIAISSGQTYQLSAYVRVAKITGDGPWVWLVQVNETGDEICKRPTGVQLTNEPALEWAELTCTFVAEEGATSFYVYMGQMAGGPTLVWVDDIAVIALDNAFANVIRTSVTDFIIRPPNNTRVSPSAYILGQDYVVVNSTSNLTFTPNFRGTKQNESYVINPLLTLQIKLTPNSRIQKGSSVLIDYDFQPGFMGFHDYDVFGGLPDHLPWPADSSSGNGCFSSYYQNLQKRRKYKKTTNVGSPHNDLAWGSVGIGCFVEPLYYDVAVDQALSLISLFAKNGTPITYINLNYDELRGIARDSRSILSNLTNGELLALSLNTINKRVDEVYPNVTILYWDDMLNPWHLHASESDQDCLQAQFYGREDGTLDTAVTLVEDKSTVFLNWFYDWPYSNPRINKSFALEWENGFRVIGCPNEDVLNIQCYARALSKSPQGIGMMDTDWDGTFVGVIPSASVSWHRIANNSLNCETLPPKHN
eukprot:m.344545 g.344545  ORF g.344545 m.344545 type:complete len:830 (+) comp24646_c0_seq1:87-2576(+)